MREFKLVLSLLFVFLIMKTSAQINMQEGVTSTLIYGKALDLKDENIEGSKYLNDFSLAKVNHGNGNFLIRYNAVVDIMEYKKDDTIVELVKGVYKHFRFENGDVYELIHYVDKGAILERYHQVLIDTNQVKISKFSSVKFVKAVAAKNSYDTSTPASYKRSKDQYFISYNGNTIPFDGKQKALESLFPQHVGIIRDFYSKNKVRERDDDMRILTELFSKF